MSGVLLAAVDAMAQPVSLADARAPDMPLVYVNPAFTAMTGYRAEDVLGSNCRFLQGPHRDAPALDELRDALATGRPTTVVLRNVRRDGTPFWNELSVSPLRDAAGQVTHAVGVQRDVTARVEAQARRDSLLAESSLVARTLQRTLLPPPLPELPWVELGVAYLAASEGAVSALAVGGDFYEVVGAGDRAALVLGDVAGRGAGAAALTGLTRYLLRGLSATEPHLPTALTRLNAALLPEVGDRFVTLIAGALTATGGRVEARLVLAGHPRPVHVRGRAAALVGAPGSLLGLLEVVALSESVLQLEPGDLLVLYTDGVTEARGTEEMYGDERLLALLAAQPQGAPAQTVADAVVDDVRRHAGSEGHDDLAVLVLRATP